MRWRAAPPRSPAWWTLKGLLCASAFVVKHAEGSAGAPLLLDRTRAAFGEVASVPGEVLVERLVRWSEGGPWPTIP